jgi:hypothetical protein
MNINLMIFAGILIAALAYVGINQFTSFRAQKPVNYAGQLPKFDIREVLNGEMITEGMIYGPTGKANTRFVATMTAQWNGDTGTMAEHFVYSSGHEQDRKWAFVMEQNGEFTATAPDIIGTAEGQQMGPTVRLRYRIQLPEDAGGHVLDVVDWMYLLDNGSVMNRSEFRKFGIKVAELVATFRQAD